MLRLFMVVGLSCALASTAAVALAAGGSAPVAGTWRALPAAPVTADFGSARAVWTGSRMIVFGRDTLTAKDAHGAPYATATVNVAAAYDPATRTWKRLAAPRAANAVGSPSLIWTGRRLVEMDAFDTLLYAPGTGRWQHVARGHGGLVAWTGHEVLAWGGGCCGDAFSDGIAFDPAGASWRTLPRSPLAGSQHPVGAWTGRELVVLVGNLDPNGKPWPARLARAAAYDPVANRWRRIAPAPQQGGTAVWDGREVIVVGAGPQARAVLAYNPVRNTWRRLSPLDSGRADALALWTGKSVLVYGGSAPSGAPVRPRNGLVYDPRADRWSALPAAPLPARLEPAAVWTGRSLIVWGGVSTGTWGAYRPAGAAFTPAGS